MVPYRVDQSPSQGMCPKNTLSKSCNEHEVDGGKTFGHGFLDISRAHIFSFTGAIVEGVLHPSFANETFFQALLSRLIYYCLKH
jgi:hypothetical protein